MPVLDAIGENWLRENRVQTALESYSTALQERTPRGLRLGVAVEELKPEI